MQVTKLDQLFSLRDHTVLVTGAAGLLGAHFCEVVASAGADVIAIDTNGEGLRDLSNKLNADDHNCLAVECDISDPEAISGLEKKIKSPNGDSSIDLINCAAVNPKRGSIGGDLSGDDRFPSYPLELWEKSINVNLTGTFLATQMVCRIIESGKVDRGSIVNISSTYALNGPDQRIYEDERGEISYKPLDYSATKAGVLGFTRALAAYYRNSNVRVNSLTPGGVYNGHSEKFVVEYSAKTILNRMALPEDYAGAIIFLCSDASSYMTGANLVVDGGWTIF